MIPVTISGRCRKENYAVGTKHLSSCRKRESKAIALVAASETAGGKPKELYAFRLWFHQCGHKDYREELHTWEGGPRGNSSYFKK